MTNKDEQIPFSEFWDNPADCPANRSDYDETVRRYRAAQGAVSVSGTICKLVGVTAAVISPILLLMTNSLRAETVIAAIGGGAAISAIGSSATSNKRTAQIAALTAWHSFN